jgi:2-dehydro-3-deoxyphosphogluconate aldolase/(4S)-4-hydroxy-2-oxoglutarate aldolase
MENNNIKQMVIKMIKETGLLPCIRLKEKNIDKFIQYAKAMYDGGARVIELPMTNPGVIEAIEAINSEFKGNMLLAAGTVLDTTSAREVILHGGSLIVNPCIVSDVMDLCHRYQIPVFSGAFTASEIFNAMQAGASMVKIFPGETAGPRYFAKIKQVFPNLDVFPSGGINLESASDFIKYGACAVSGNSVFMKEDKIAENGFEWLTDLIKEFIKIVKTAKEEKNLNNNFSNVRR